MWLPLAGEDAEPVGYVGRAFDAYARLRPGVSREAAEAELTTLLENLRSQRPGDVDAPETKPVSILTFQEEQWGVLGTVMFSVLNLLSFSIPLLAAVNVGNLLLVRTNERIKEIGVRLALGASRFRVTTQAVTENVVLCALGGSIAIFLAAAHSRNELLHGRLARQRSAVLVDLESRLGRRSSGGHLPAVDRRRGISVAGARREQCRSQPHPARWHAVERWVRYGPDFPRSCDCASRVDFGCDARRQRSGNHRRPAADISWGMDTANLHMMTVDLPWSAMGRRRRGWHLRTACSARCELQAAWTRP